MLKVGIAGLGFMGWIHWLAYKETPGVEVAAICTPEENRRAGDWTDIKGNFGPPGQHVDLSGIRTYENLEEMLADASLDVVDICLPPALHCESIVRAANSGKHVFCEKPLALNLDDCDRAVAACEENGKQLMVGHVLPFFTEYQYARETIASGTYGKLLGGSFKRVISDPLWLKHFYDPEKIGGPLFDLHVHDAHFIRLLFGKPTGVYSCGRVRGEVVDYCNSIFQFQDPSIAVACTSGVINQQGRPFTQGFEIHLEQATIQFDFQAFADTPESMPLKVLTQDGEVIRPELTDGDPVHAFGREIAEMASCLSKNQSSEILSGTLARDAIAICQLQAQSVQENRFVSAED
jgi:predicted dehydrogenase